MMSSIGAPAAMTAIGLGFGAGGSAWPGGRLAQRTAEHVDFLRPLRPGRARAAGRTAVAEVDRDARGVPGRAHASERSRRPASAPWPPGTRAAPYPSAAPRGAWPARPARLASSAPPAGRGCRAQLPDLRLPPFLKQLQRQLPALGGQPAVFIGHCLRITDRRG